MAINQEVRRLADPIWLIIQLPPSRGTWAAPEVISTFASDSESPFEKWGWQEREEGSLASCRPHSRQTLCWHSPRWKLSQPCLLIGFSPTMPSSKTSKQNPCIITAKKKTFPHISFDANNNSSEETESQRVPFSSQPWLIHLLQESLQGAGGADGNRRRKRGREERGVRIGMAEAREYKVHLRRAGWCGWILVTSRKRRTWMAR